MGVFSDFVLPLKAEMIKDAGGDFFGFFVAAEGGDGQRRGLIFIHCVAEGGDDQRRGLIFIHYVAELAEIW